MGRCRTLMVQGCTSNAGKSLIVTALCRIARDAGLRVAPFKPQNMANNSAVTVDNGEIGRAQALQAVACGIEPRVDFNPVLLKPSGDMGSQVVIHGKVIGNMNARAYMDYRPTAFEAVLQSHARLEDEYDLILAEGAGSPAEINLRHQDIANMGFAEAVDCPVWLVGNIDHGGVFAHLYGTLALLSESEGQRISHLLINGFRGDASLLTPAIEWLERESAKPVAGVIPMLENFVLDAEDSLNLNRNTRIGGFKIAVLIAGRIANHTDFDPLASHPDVELIWVSAGQDIPEVDLIILPGSKTTIADLTVLRQQGWDNAIEQHVSRGKKVFGICGGYQILGTRIDDPSAIEGTVTSAPGLALLPVKTTLEPAKILSRVKGYLWDNNTPFHGYEIHMGQSAVDRDALPFCRTEGGHDDGIMRDDRLVAGTYMHGILDQPESLVRLLSWAGLSAPTQHDYLAERELQIDRIADAVRRYCSVNALEEVLDNFQFGR